MTKGTIARCAVCLGMAFLMGCPPTQPRPDPNAPLIRPGSEPQVRTPAARRIVVRPVVPRKTASKDDTMPPGMAQAMGKQKGDDSPAKPGTYKRKSNRGRVRAVYSERGQKPHPLAQKYCDAIHHLSAKQYSTCCKKGFVRIHVGPECVRVLTAALTAKAVTLHEAEVDKCHAAMKKLHEGCSWVGFFPPHPPKECLGIIHGTLEKGKKCRSSLECKGKLSCYGLSSTYAGTCWPPRATGQNCGTVTDPLASFAWQTNLDETHPRCEGYCVRSVCQSGTQEGKKCWTDRQCGPGHHCADTVCVKGEVAKKDAPCSSRCEAGMRCIKRRCRKLKEIGEACTAEAECRAGCLIPPGKKQGVCGVQCALLRKY